MQLQFIALDNLSIDKANMRHGRKIPDVADLLPTVRKRGILQTLLVRPGAAPGTFEIVAGRRRYHAACIVAGECAAPANDDDDKDPPPMLLPCAILDDGDDADAVEASLIENLARLDPDEVAQWETFTRLVRQGRSAEDLSATFGLPERMIRRVLALGNLLPRIRELYRREAIDAVAVRHLTLASKARQQEWLALQDDPAKRAPTGHQLKSWLFGGAAIPTKHALFDLADYPGQIVADLFGESPLFADSEAFWTAQNAAIVERRSAYLEAGWREVVILSPQEYFSGWEHEKTPKRKGGRVYIDVNLSGEVCFHEGYLTRKEARRIAGGEPESGAAPGPAKPQRGELTSALQTYLDLHRHAAVRAQLTDQPAVALRLMVAHAISGSHLWSVQPEPQTAKSDAIRESVETCRGETVFDERRRAVLALLGFDPDTPRVIRGNRDAYGVAGLFLRLMGLDDDQVMAIIATVIGESLAAGSAAVEVAGAEIGIDMADWWEADAAFFDALRDREVLTAMVAEVAGEAVASANAKEKGTTLKHIIMDHLQGSGSRPKVERWVPRWMAFPPGAYTGRGGIGAVSAHALVEAARTELDAPDTEGPDPDAPAISDPAALMRLPEGGGAKPGAPWGANEDGETAAPEGEEQVLATPPLAA